MKSVFKTILPFGSAIVGGTAVIAAAVIGLTLSEQHQLSTEIEKYYQLQASALITNYLEQQKHFAVDVAAQPLAALAGTLPGAKKISVVLAGTEVPKDLSFSHQDLLHRAILAQGKVQPEVSYMANKEAIIDFVEPLPAGAGLVLVSVPFEPLKKDLESLAAQGIEVTQEVNKEHLSIYAKNEAQVNSIVPIAIANSSWQVKVLAPSSNSISLPVSILMLLGLLGSAAGIGLLARKLSRAIEEDMQSLLAFMQHQGSFPGLNFQNSQSLLNALSTYKPVAVDPSQQKMGDHVNISDVVGIVDGVTPDVNKAGLVATPMAEHIGSIDEEINLSTAQELQKAEEESSSELSLDFTFGAHNKVAGTENDTVPKHIFRTYDIRGKAHTEITKVLARQIGLAVGSEARVRGEQTIVVGRDARLSSVELCKALIDGLQESGCDVLDVGQVPTPVLYYAAKNIGTGSGVMVTASHNPAPDNGFKIMLGNHTLVDQEIFALRERILAKDFNSGAGGYSERQISEDYLQHLTDDVILARSFNVVVDAGNGVAGPLAIKVLEGLGCNVSALYCDPDGNFPNHEPDPTKPENLEDLLSDIAISGADVGIALDGDGDRVVIVTNSTKIIASDKLLMLFAKELLATQPGADILFDVKCSRDLVTIITSHGGRPVMTKSGHAWLKAGLEETHAPLAGEMSGHFIFNDRWGGFDDGLYAAARFLEILANNFGSSADDLFSDFPVRSNTPEISIPVAEAHKKEVMDQLIANNADIPNAIINTLDGLRVEFPDGWGLVRASNTGAHLVARFEGNDDEALQRVQECFKYMLQEADPMMLLPF